MAEQKIFTEDDKLKHKYMDERATNFAKAFRSDLFGNLNKLTEYHTVDSFMLRCAEGTDFTPSGEILDVGQNIEELVVMIFFDAYFNDEKMQLSIEMSLDEFLEFERNELGIILFDGVDLDTVRAETIKAGQAELG